MEVLESIPRPHSCPALVTSRHRDSHRSRPVPHRVVYSCFNNGHRRQEVLEILDTPTTSVDRHRNPTEHHVTAGRHRHPTEHHDTWPPHSRDEQNISSGHSYSKEQQISHSRSTSADHELPESARLRGEQHIEHRKCGSSHCEVCRPPLTDYRDLRQLPEPVLFVRWEKRGNCHSGATLRKVNYKVNGVGQVIRSVDKSCEGRVKESSQVIRRKVKVKLDTLRRQKVIARRDQDGLYYPAVVQQCSDPRHASVIYDDGTHAHVLTRNVIPTGGAVARPPLTSGDCVLMRVVNLDSDTECYVPAIVQHGPHRQEAHSKFFSVLMYNGQKASTLRSYLVKISKERFELASMYIADQHNENRKDVEDLVYVSSPRFPKKGKTSSRKSADTRTRSRSRSPSSEDSRPSSRESRHSVKEQKQTRSRSNSPSDGYESKGDSQDESGKSWRRESHRERQTDKLTTVKEEEKAQRRAGDTSPTLSEVESEGKRSEKSPQGSSAPGSRSSTPRNDSGDRNKESVRSQTSRSSELERLKQELLHQQARQERQKKKLKKKAKRLQRREKELTLKEEQDAADALVTPSADEGSTPRLIQLRKTLAQLRPGEEVLARWSDDGWYYRGMVRQSHDDCSYSLEDSTGFVERIWREDIISENDNADAVYELDHKVVALHPDYSFSYAPAAVTGVTDSEVEVRFYDARSARLPWSEAYHVTGEKYQQDVTYIAKRESELVGAAVVARDDETGAYYPGCVRRKEEDSCDYLISWSDGSVSVQSAVHIFSAFTRRRPLTVGDRVLAMADPVHVQFLPGHIAGSVDGKLVVQFCDGEMREGVDLTLCYWLGQQYYDMALQYYKAREPRHR